jgi:hypothetical protein
MDLERTIALLVAQTAALEENLSSRRLAPLPDLLAAREATLRQLAGLLEAAGPDDRLRQREALRALQARDEALREAYAEVLDALGRSLNAGGQRTGQAEARRPPLCIDRTV